MRRVLLAVLVLVATTACGVTPESEPRALERSEAPFRVFAEQPVQQPPTSDLQAQLFFVLVDRLTATTRPVPQPGSPEQIASELFDGVTDSEREAGLSSAIPSVASLRSVDVRNRIAVVSLEGFGESVRADQVTAFAQIVATLDARTDIDGVRFRTGDLDLSVPRGDGSLTDAPVDRTDYPVLLDEAPTVGPAGASPSAPAGASPPPPPPAP